MPSGVTKEMFKSFIKYYDPEIFVAAGRRIRTTVLSADELSPTERVKKIAQLFACFKNPNIIQISCGKQPTISSVKYSNFSCRP